MFDFANMFRGNAAPSPAPAPVAGTPAAAPAPVAGAPAAPAAAPVAGTPAAPAPAPASPLDNFTNLWHTTPEAGAGDKPLFEGLTPQAIQEAASKMNFAQAIPAETLAKITAGGADATQAFAEAINRVAQLTTAQSMLSTTKIVEQAVQQATARERANLPSLIKQHAVVDGLRAENPMLSHPAVSPVVGAMEQSLRTQYPNASATEIRTMAVDAMKAVASAFNPTKPQAEGPGGKDTGTDWDQWMTS